MNYFVYVIRYGTSVEDKNSKMYIGCSNSTNTEYNPIKFFNKKAKETKGSESPRYQKLLESFEKNGMRNHTVHKTKYTNLSKENAEEIVFKMLTNLGKDRMLNDIAINPEKYTCDKCGKVFKKIYKKKHDKLYCNSMISDELDGLLSSAADDLVDNLRASKQEELP